jgi:ABC-2 type transport system ATP-binding protein
LSVIQVRGLTKSFPLPARSFGELFRRQRKVALRGVDLEVEQGEIFGLLGPNGAGKTTMIKILCGLIEADGGTATVGGHDVGRDGGGVRRSIGVVYGDERSFFWRLSVVENLRFYARLYGVPSRIAERRISELTDLLGLGDARHLRIQTISSGMKQRAAIARGLVHDPAVIVMDEPTRSLDPVGSEEFHALIRTRVAAGGRTVLIATHLMSEAEVLCGRLTLIDQGRTIMTGTAAELKAQVSDQIVYRLVLMRTARSSLVGLEALPGVLSVELVRDGETQEVEVRLDGHGMPLARAIRHLVEVGADVLSCTRQEPSLEEVFRRVVRQSRGAVEARAS